jgi:hypothetical protein
LIDLFLFSAILWVWISSFKTCNARKQEKADLVEQLEDEIIPFFRAVPGGTDGETYKNGENLV